MKYFIGLIIASAGFKFASDHLKQDISEYWDSVAFFVVIFGTLAVMIVNTPALPFMQLIKLLVQKFFKRNTPLKILAQNCLEAHSSKGKSVSGKDFETGLLKDGIEMIELQLEARKIEDILSLRQEQHLKRLNLLAAWLKRSSKYPPAFGLAGTVLGLIHLMKGISVGIETKETGLRMAVALIATFYGLIISNLILNPLGEWLTEEIKRDEVRTEMVIQTVMALKNNNNSLELQETLNSYLDAKEKLSLKVSELWSEGGV